MPAVPGAFEGSRVRAQGTVNPTIPAGAFGQPQAEAAAASARGLQRGGQQLDALAAGMQQEAQQELLSNRLDARRRMSEAATAAQIAAEAETTPDGTTRVYGQHREAARAAALDNVPSGTERTWREAEFQSVFNASDRHAAGLTQRRRADGIVAEVQATLVTEGQAAARGDPLAARRVEEALAGAQEAGALTAAQRQQLGQRWRGNVELNAFRRQAQVDPAVAVAGLNAGRYPNLTDDQMFQAETFALTRSRERQLDTEREERRAEAAENRRERAATQALAQWNDLAAQGIVPPERAAQTLALARGTSVEPVVRSLIREAETTDRFRMAPPAQQRTTLEADEARIRSGNANDSELRAARQRLAIARQQTEGYRTLGWQQGIQDNLIRRDEAPPPLNLADPNTINARVILAERLTAHRGEAVPVFSAADLQEITRQALAAQNDPVTFTRLTAAVNSIQDPAIRAQTISQVERARGDAGQMPQGSLAVIAGLAGGDASQQRAATQLTQMLTTDADERVRRIGEAPALRAALETAISDPRMQAARATGAVSREGGNRWNTYQDLVEKVAARYMAQGEEPSRAVTRALDLTFAGARTVIIPGLATMNVPPGFPPDDALRRGLTSLRQGWLDRIPLDPANGAEVNARNRDLARIARNAEWVSVGPDSFALVGTGQYGIRRALFTTDAATLRDAATQGASGGLLDRLRPGTGARRIDDATWAADDPSVVPRPDPAAARPGAPNAMNPAALRDDVAERLGIPAHAAAGLVSGLHAESGLIPGRQESAASMAEGSRLTGATGNRGGLGLAQWTGPRRDAFERWARENNLSVTSEEANVGFLVHELRTTHPEILERLRRATTAREAASITHDFLAGGAAILERHRGAHMARADEFAALQGRRQ